MLCGTGIRTVQDTVLNKKPTKPKTWGNERRSVSCSFVRYIGRSVICSVDRFVGGLVCRSVDVIPGELLMRDLPLPTVPYNNWWWRHSRRCDGRGSTDIIVGIIVCV